MLQGLPKQDHTYAAYSDNHVEFLFTPPQKIGSPEDDEAPVPQP